jgi:DNA polymerase
VGGPPDPPHVANPDGTRPGTELMDPARRLDYLRTIGIDVWLPRNGAPAPVPSPVAEVTPMPDDVGDATQTKDALLEPARHPQPEVRLSARITHAPESGLPSLAPEVEAEWDALKSEVLTCKKCALHATRTQGVFGVGNRRADWLVIGEAPGAEEDRQGEPFVGRAGQLLNAMLKAIGLPRETVFIANVLKSRPPGNRDPKPEEVAACLPYLMRQVALLQPKLMLAVGRIAAQNLLATDLSLSRLRGQVHTFGELNTPLIVTYHPAYLLRTPADKRKAWEDLKFARSVFRRLAMQES